MIVKVVQEFKDKHTGELHKVGEEFTVTKKRFNEILSVGEFVVEVKENKAE